jgi:hypothetical protein
MLLIYPQSPKMRYPSSISGTPAVTPTSSSTTPLLQYQEYQPRSNNTSPYLSISHSPVRRSSTSDILTKKPSNPEITPANKKSSQGLNSSGSGSALVVDTNHLSANSAHSNRRPSTSELLRKARERKGSEGKIGRSFSSGTSLARGANRNRRLSMAF